MGGKSPGAANLDAPSMRSFVAHGWESTHPSADPPTRLARSAADSLKFTTVSQKTRFNLNQRRNPKLSSPFRKTKIRLPYQLQLMSHPLTTDHCSSCTTASS